MFQYNLKIDDAPILRLLDSILEEALRRNASDIHCEPGEEGTRIRCRIDGVLQQTQLVPSFRHQPLVSVIKLLGGMDIAEKRQPQDGRAFVERDGVRTDLRISTLPTLTGEKSSCGSWQPTGGRGNWMTGIGMPVRWPGIGVCTAAAAAWSW